jgi:excisionase family DNA binding protein
MENPDAHNNGGPVTSIPASPLLTAQQAAKYLSCGERSLWKWEQEGSLGSVRRGRWVRFLIADLDAAIAQMRIPARTKRLYKRRMQRFDQQAGNN